MITLMLLIICVILISHWLISSPFYWRNKGVPYEIPLPIFGSTIKTFNQPLYQFWNEKYKQWSKYKLYGFHFFGRPSLFISDPDVLKQIFIVDADHFMSHGFHLNQEVDTFARNVFHSEGEQWKSTRSKITPYFSPARMKMMTHLLDKHVDNCIILLEESVGQGPVEVQKGLGMRLVTDVIVSTGFGVETNSFKDPNSYFFLLQRELMRPTTFMKMMVSILSPKLFDLLGFTFFSHSVMKKLSSFVRDVISMRNDGIGVRPDFIQGMIELMNKDETTEPKELYYKDGTRVTRFDMDTVTAQCMMLYFAGTETTGNTMGFLFNELALNQDIQDKVRKEINDVLKDLTDGCITYEHIQKMTYTYMAVQETLRKYPVVPILIRKCTKPYRKGELAFKTGSIAITSVVGIHWDSKYYPDPEKFIPDRFRPGSGGSTPFLSFGLGPRTCVGMKFAFLQIVYTLAKILPKYRIQRSSKTESFVTFDRKNPTLTAKNGIWVTIERI